MLFSRSLLWIFAIKLALTSSSGAHLGTPYLYPHYVVGPSKIELLLTGLKGASFYIVDGFNNSEALTWRVLVHTSGFYCQDNIIFLPCLVSYVAFSSFGTFDYFVVDEILEGRVEPFLWIYHLFPIVT